jgi:hypothetical protein
MGPVHLFPEPNSIHCEVVINGRTVNVFVGYTKCSPWPCIFLAMSAASSVFRDRCLVGSSRQTFGTLRLVTVQANSGHSSDADIDVP